MVLAFLEFQALFCQIFVMDGFHWHGLTPNPKVYPRFVFGIYEPFG